MCTFPNDVGYVAINETGVAVQAWVTNINLRLSWYLNNTFLLCPTYFYVFL